MAIKDVTADKIEITSCISRMFSISAATFRAIKPNKIKALIKITKNKFPRKPIEKMENPVCNKRNRKDERTNG